MIQYYHRGEETIPYINHWKNAPKIAKAEFNIQNTFSRN